MMTKQLLPSLYNLARLRVAARSSCTPTTSSFVRSITSSCRRASTPFMAPKANTASSLSLSSSTSDGGEQIKSPVRAQLDAMLTSEVKENSRMRKRNSFIENALLVGIALSVISILGTLLIAGISSLSDAKPQTANKKR